jgi:hypothetical protein
MTSLEDNLYASSKLLGDVMSIRILPNFQTALDVDNNIVYWLILAVIDQE